jgi:hypothetical protein
MKAFNRVFPMVAIDEVIPIGNQVAERATVIAKRNTTIHATTSLTIKFVRVERLVDLFPVAQAHRHGPMARNFAFPF